MFQKMGFTFILSAVLSISILSAQEKPQMTKIHTAVLPFANTTSDAMDTVSLAEILQAELVGKDPFLVVERERMDSVMKEQALSLSGVVSEDQAVEIGEMLGAEAIITGTVSYWEDRYLLSVKNIRVDTGEVIFADTVSAWSVSGIAEVIPQLGKRLVSLAQGKKVAAFKIKSKPKAPKDKNEGDSAGFILFKDSIYNNSYRQKYYFAIAPGISIGSALGFPDSMMGGVMGRFKAPGETFFQLGLDLQVDMGKIDDSAGIIRLIAFPFLAFNIYNNGFLSLTPFTGAFFSGDLISATPDTWIDLYTMSQVGWDIGLEGGIYLGPRTILKLNWKAGIPFSYSSKKQSELDALLPKLSEYNGIPHQNVNLFIEFLR